MRIGQLTREVKRSFTTGIVHFATMDGGYTEVLPIEMGGGTGRLRAEKPHTAGRSN